VNHVNNRHTFEHFDFGDPGVLGRHTSTLFLSGTNVLNTITGILANAAVTNGTWNGSKIQVGSYSIRIAPYMGGVGGYRFTAFFLEVAAGIPIPLQVLQAMVNNNLF